MKFYRTTCFLGTIFLFFQMHTTKACDICGCGAGGGFLGVLPQFHKNLVGSRYYQNRFIHPPTDLNQTDGVLLLSDMYHAHEMWMRYYATEKIQLFAFVPYRIHIRKYEDNTRKQISGVGDIQLNFLYEIINQASDPEKLIRHIWFTGGGLKLPTGQYMQRDPGGRMYPLPFQTGSGAWAFEFQNLYILRFKNIGFQSDLLLKYRMKNELEYKLGNFLQIGGNAFYWWQVSPDLAILPMAGYQYEYAHMDTEYGRSRVNTGGTFGFGSVGVDVYYKKMIFQLFSQLPVHSLVESAQPDAGVRFGAGVALFW